MTELELTGPLLLDGAPVLCRCGSGGSLTLATVGPRETWPARLGCRSCGAAEDHPLITNGLVTAAAETSSGRRKATDRDVFAAAWREHFLEGECAATFVLDDAVTALREVTKAGKREVRKRTRRWWRITRRTTGHRARQLLGGAQAAALTAAWDLQTGGAGPARQPARRCRVKGCRGGWLTISTRVHGSSGRTEQVKTPCAACHRAG
jgi:hypothetical protein